MPGHVVGDDVLSHVLLLGGHLQSVLLVSLRLAAFDGNGNGNVVGAGRHVADVDDCFHRVHGHLLGEGLGPGDGRCLALDPGGGSVSPSPASFLLFIGEPVSSSPGVCPNLNIPLEFNDVPDTPDSFSQPSYFSTSLCTLLVLVCSSLMIYVPLCCLFFLVFRLVSSCSPSPS